MQYSVEFEQKFKLVLKDISIKVKEDLCIKISKGLKTHIFLVRLQEITIKTCIPKVITLVSQACVLLVEWNEVILFLKLSF